MRHGKKRTYRKRGGAWLDPTSWDLFKKKPEQAVMDAPVAAEQAVGDVVEPLGAEPEPSGVPGGINPEAPAADLAGGRRRRSRKTKRKTRGRRRH
jgi:hypothetical protein